MTAAISALANADVETIKAPTHPYLSLAGGRESPALFTASPPRISILCVHIYKPRGASGGRRSVPGSAKSTRFSTKSPFYSAWPCFVLCPSIVFADQGLNWHTRRGFGMRPWDDRLGIRKENETTKNFLFWRQTPASKLTAAIITILLSRDVRVAGDNGRSNAPTACLSRPVITRPPRGNQHGAWRSRE